MRSGHDDSVRAIRRSEPSSRRIHVMGATPAQGQQPSSEKVSDEIERWLHESSDHTVGALLDLFGKKSFAVLFIILLGVSALPLPTGGATHVFDVIAVL